MLNEWLKTAEYDAYEEEAGGIYLETKDWSLILELTGSTKNELIAEMAEDWTYNTERGPFYIEADIDGYHITAHHWSGANWWGILVEPAKELPAVAELKLSPCPF
nr:MAG TPA: hypothetical protein [Caudoviricetes sp.]